MLQTNVFLLPELVTDSATLQGSCSVVIDVLRATTTIVHALGNQATSITPVISVEQARLMAAQSECLLGGERDCIRLAGFDLGNSPAEYSQRLVQGRQIALTTTNGTRAMMACLEADSILIAAFANRSAVADAIAQYPRVNILCAGTNGEITLEDTLLAGALAAGRNSDQQNDQASIAMELWQQCQQDADPSSNIERKLLQSRGGKNLQQAGMVSDITLCAQLDTHSIVPIMCSQSKTIQLSNRNT